ncbi:MarR family transcriptional regulator [Streptomyces sp. NPDC059389]|uniref:MarR family winged helix-turn-helix transcriptional regulator n=1 Tax=Streptomyces sp. NPDC059389 TaxID=3346818 RepID=UPI0036A9F00D
MSRPEPFEGPLYETAREVADAAGALTDACEQASQSASPRLSALQLRALTAVRGSPGINLTRLAEEVGAAAPATSRLCDRLEAAGLLRRSRADDDRREIVLTVTQSGREILEIVADRRTKAVHEILKRLSPRQRQDLLHGLQAFADAADEAKPSYGM